MSLRFVNAVANPIMRAILRSPLHRLASAGVMLITITGRRTAKRFTIPVQYAQDSEGIVIVVGWAEKKRWWRNLRDGGGEVEVRVRGVRIAAHAEAITGEKDPERVAAALARYLARFPKATSNAPELDDAVLVLVTPRP